MPLNYGITPYGQHYSDSDMRSAEKARHPPHLAHHNFNGIEIASHSFLAGSLAGVRLLRVICKAPGKGASLCMIRRLGDFSGGHLQGDF